MIGEIDKSLKPQESRLFLCKPNRETIAELSEAYGKRIVTNYNGIHELSFTLPYKIEKNKKFIRNQNINKLRGHYLIRYESRTMNEYFIISQPRNSAQDGFEVKEVQCYLLPFQLRQILVRNYDETKQLYSIDGDGILNETLLKKTNWKVGYVNPELLTKSTGEGIFRTFSISEQNLIQLIEDLSSTFECFFEWDTINFEVNIYKKGQLDIDKGLNVEYGKYLKDIDDEPDFDNVVTRLYIYGKDGISIGKYNASGLDYLEDFSYYLYPFERDASRNVIKHSNYMSDGLCHAILDYNELLSTKVGQFETLLDDKNTLQTTKSELENGKFDEDTGQILVKGLFQLETELELIIDQIDVAIANDDSVSQLNEDKANKEAEIQAKKDEIANVDTQIADVDTQIETLQSDIAIENNFTNEQLIERNGFIRERVWMDTNYTDELELYNIGKEKIKQISQPRVRYTISLINFLKVVRCQKDWDKIRHGYLINIVYPSFDIKIKAKVVQFVHDEDNNEISIEIANHEDIENGFLSMKDLLKKASSASTSVDMNKFKWNKADEVNTLLQKYINSSIDANKQAIVAGNNENYVLDNHGLTMKDPQDPLNYVRILHNVLAFTNDGGQTFKHAITPNGIVGENIRGLLGQFVKIRADQIVLGGDGVTETSLNDNINNIATDVVDNKLVNYVDQTTYSQDISDIQSQIDGNITSWFYEYEPTLSNLPASNWITDEEKNNHLGDLFYNVSNGYGYRFALVNGVYKWTQVRDNDIQKALNDASNAQDTADRKRRVFINQPVPPYDIGDLWSQGNDGELMKCIVAKTEGQLYSENDWDLATKYDKTSENTANNTSNVGNTSATDIETGVNNSVQQGYNYNQTFITQNGIQVKDTLDNDVVKLGDIDGNGLLGLIALHDDGTYTQITNRGLERWVNGESKPYQYETYITTASTFNRSDGWFNASNNPEKVQAWESPEIIQLPERFKGKDFQAYVSLMNMNIPVASESGSDAVMHLYVDSIDNVNATVSVIAYARAYATGGTYYYRGMEFTLIATV